MREHPVAVVVVDQEFQILLVRAQRPHETIPRPRIIGRMLCAIRGFDFVVLFVIKACSVIKAYRRRSRGACVGISGADSQRSWILRSRGSSGGCR